MRETKYQHIMAEQCGDGTREHIANGNEREAYRGARSAAHHARAHFMLEAEAQERSNKRLRDVVAKRIPAGRVDR